MPSRQIAFGRNFKRVPKLPRSPQAASTFLQRVPPELRAEIYKLTFTVDGPITLLRSHPDAALLLTCQQVLCEALDDQWEARQLNWETSSFFLRVNRTDITLKIPQQIHNRRIVQIIRYVTRLDISSTEMIPAFTYRHGVWTCVGSCCNNPNRGTNSSSRHPHHIIVLPISGSEQPRNVRTNETIRVVESCVYVPRLLRRNGRILNAVERNGSGVDHLWIAILRDHVVINSTVAYRAVGYRGLSTREVVAMLEWYSFANYLTENQAELEAWNPEVMQRYHDRMENSRRWIVVD